MMKMEISLIGKISITRIMIKGLSKIYNHMSTIIIIMKMVFGMVSL